MPLVARVFLFAGALNAMLAVLLGAFGAHALRGRLSSAMLAVYHTGNQYHFYHALGLLAVGLVAAYHPTSPLVKWAGGLMIGGIILFSGSLYVLAITGATRLGAITPIGGLAFIIGWLLLAIAVLKASTGSP